MSSDMESLHRCRKAILADKVIDGLNKLKIECLTDPKASDYDRKEFVALCDKRIKELTKELTRERQRKLKDALEQEQIDHEAFIESMLG